MLRPCQSALIFTAASHFHHLHFSALTAADSGDITEGHLSDVHTETTKCFILYSDFDAWHWPVKTTWVGSRKDCADYSKKSVSTRLDNDKRKQHYILNLRAESSRWYTYWAFWTWSEIRQRCIIPQQLGPARASYLLRNRFSVEIGGENDEQRSCCIFPLWKPDGNETWPRLLLRQNN